MKKLYNLPIVVDGIEVKVGQIWEASDKLFSPIEITAIGKLSVLGYIEKYKEEFVMEPDDFVKLLKEGKNN